MGRRPQGRSRIRATTAILIGEPRGSGSVGLRPGVGPIPTSRGPPVTHGYPPGPALGSRIPPAPSGGDRARGRLAELGGDLPDVERLEEDPVDAEPVLLVGLD